MEMKLINETLADLDKNGIQTKISFEDGQFTVEAYVPNNQSFPTIISYQDKTIIGALRLLSNDNEMLTFMSNEQFLRLNAAPEPEPSEVIDTLSIMNPYLADLRVAFDKAIQSAADAVDMDSTATITAKLVLNEDPMAPEFANEAKLFCRAKFDVGVSIKREVNKYIGSVLPFGTRVVDGRMLMINPDRQMEIDEVIRKAEQEAGNVAKPVDLMADAPVDPDQEPMSFDA